MRLVLSANLRPLAVNVSDGSASVGDNAEIVHARPQREIAAMRPDPQPDEGRI